MKCASCGAQIPENARFCSYCGTEAVLRQQPVAQPPEQVVHVHNHYYQPEPQVVERIVYVTPQKSPKSRVLLLVLFWLAGVFGAHKFYSGRIGMGVFYLLTGGGFGIGLFVDFFSILFGTPRDKDGLPIKWS